MARPSRSKTCDHCFIDTMSTKEITRESDVSNLSRVAGKYLTVALEDESYGIPVLSVREIIRLSKITPVPQAPSYVSGVINLRGRVIAVIDLRVKFGLPADTTEHTCVVVVSVPCRERMVQLGLVVDSVEEVVTITAADIEETPDFGVKVDTAYLRGIAKTKGRVAMLLDINHVVTGDSMRAIADLAR